MGLKLTEAEAEALGIVADKPKKRRGPKLGTSSLPKYKEPKTPPYFLFEAACASHGLPEPKREFLFHATRKWRFDFAWILPWGLNGEPKIALEIEGGVWTNGAHVRGSHFISDMDKYNEAQISGWKVIRCTPEQVDSGEIFTTLKRAMA